MSYQLEITSTAEKELKKLQGPLQDRIINKIFALKNNARPFGSKKLKGSEDYRLRQGDYRIIYSIHEAAKKIKILDIGHRKDVYR